MSESDESAIPALITIGILLVLVTTGVGGCMYVAPQYGVYEAKTKGEAEYAQAEQNRKVKTLEAKAKLESAKFEADAEIVRAKGVAKANQIIGDSLKGNESYLRYLWINNLNGDQGERIYIPTEAGLPILEARK